MFAERYGYGTGAVDRDPPLKPDTADGRCCLELALRVCTEALSDSILGPRLYPVFAAGRKEDADGHLARLLMLLDRLIDVELPRLRQAVRGEARTRTSWQSEPRGGRIDPVSSLRRSGGILPGAWLVRRTERSVESPVNRLLAALLGQVVLMLDRIRSRVHQQRLRFLHRERSLLDRASRALTTFLASSPIGSLTDTQQSIQNLFQEARHRRAEMQRIASFVEWWKELCAAELQRINQGAEGATLSVDTAYELVVALSLLLSLRERFAAIPGPGLRFAMRAGEIEARMGMVPLGLRRMRPATLILEVRPTAKDARLFFVEARNQTKDAAGQVATYLELLTTHRSNNYRGFLFLPRMDEADELMRSCPIEQLANDPIGFWNPLLADIAQTLEENS